MTKRKILLLAMSLCMVAILAVGGTLAYFTAEEEADNLFTMGYVDAEIEEDFDPESELVPGATINKDVHVNNKGTTGLYTRLHIAVRSELDAGDPSKAAERNFLNLYFHEDNFGEGGWSFADSMAGDHLLDRPAEGWNFYNTVTDGTNTVPMIIEGKTYNVYVVTYTSEIKPGKSSPQCLNYVKLDERITATPVYDEDGNLVKVVYDDIIVGNPNFEVAAEEYKNKNNKAEVHIKVWAEVVQADADGFTDAYVALNTAFGVPGEYNPWDK